MLKLFACIIYEHDLRLVALAGCICAMACFTTLTLLARAQTPGSSWPALWVGIAAVVFGAGVWSLHFVAMLAFKPEMSMAYDVRITALSIVTAILGSAVAFFTWRRLRSPIQAGILGGSLLGIAVSLMHYSGMAAMQAPGRITVDWDQVVASILLGMFFGSIALSRAHAIDRVRRRAEICLWLSLCVCSVHFTGISAITIAPAGMALPHGALTGSSSLALMVGIVSLAIMLTGLTAALMDQRMKQRTVMELRRMRLLANLSQEVMLIHRHGAILEANAASGLMFGIRFEDLIGCRVLDLFAADDRARVSRRIDNDATDLPPEEVMVRTAGGRLVPVEITSSGTDYDGKPAIAMALRDLSDRKTNEERIRHLAHHDSLTDLPNRFLLTERLTRALDSAAEDAAGVALLYLDLDRFKPVNDLMGHAGGDALLIQVADRLRAELRPVDTLARIGGDEFVIVTPIGQSPQKAGALAARLVDTLNRPFEVLGRAVEIGASIGVALYPTDADGQEALLRAADTALYRVKEEGRGAFRLYEPTMDDHLQARRRLEQDLRHVVERNQLELHYQPVVNCRTGRMDGFEALVRWRHPERGMIPPLDFIPLAEETLQIGRIGEWVLQTACTAAMGWADPYWVAVNVSPVQFRQADFAARVGATLAQTGLPPGRLEIEITESVFLDDRGRAVAVMAELRRLGVRISLDDFGTGYSSLSYLCSFAFDKIKIDRSFINNLGRSTESDMIVRTIIGLGQNLGVAITAEGIETVEQLALIQSGGCDHVQGFLLGRPQLHLPEAPITPGRPLLEIDRATAAAPRLRQEQLAALTAAD